MGGGSQKENQTLIKLSFCLKAPSIPEDQSFVQNQRTITCSMEGTERLIPLQEQYKG